MNHPMAALAMRYHHQTDKNNFKENYPSDNRDGVLDRYINSIPTFDYVWVCPFQLSSGLPLFHCQSYPATHIIINSLWVLLERFTQTRCLSWSTAECYLVLNKHHRQSFRDSNLLWYGYLTITKIVRYTHTHNGCCTRYRSADGTFGRFASPVSLNYMQNEFFTAIKILVSQTYLDV